MLCTLELAKACEVEQCYQMIEEGKQFQREQGFEQWTEDYPNLDTIRSDVAAGIGYAFKVDGVIAGYLCLDFSGEPAYNQIEGAWSADQPYGVVHRMAFSQKYRGMGLTSAAFAQIEQCCREKGVPYIQMDTDFPNKRMQHIMEKNGFRQCGVIVFQDSGKLAYDKLLI